MKFTQRLHKSKRRFSIWTHLALITLALLAFNAQTVQGSGIVNQLTDKFMDYWTYCEKHFTNDWLFECEHGESGLVLNDGSWITNNQLEFDYSKREYC